MWCLHALVLLWATTGVLARDSGLGPGELTFWRSLLAFVSSVIFVRLVRRGSLRCTWRQFFEFVGVGVLMGVHWVCFFGAVKWANVSICAAGMGATSFFTSLAEPMLLRKRWDWREVGLGVLVLFGLLLVVGFDGRYHVGLLLALGASLLAAVFPVLNRGLMLKYDEKQPLQVVTWEFLGAALVVLFALPWLVGGGWADAGSVYWGLFLWELGDVWRVLYLSVICTTLAYYWHTRLLKTLSAYTVNLTINFEPVYTVILAAILFHEYRLLHVTFYVGMGTICVANVLHTMMRPKAPGRFAGNG